MATTASADFCTPFSRGCPVDSRSRQACRPPTVSRCVLGDRPCRIYRRAVRTSIGHLDLMLDCPPHGGLVSGSCSSGLKLPSWSRTPRRQRSPSLPSDSASRPTPLLRRMVPLVAAHRGLAPPKHTTCVAHIKKASQTQCLQGLIVGPRRFERPTSSLSGTRSNQLSYEPVNALKPQKFRRKQQGEGL